MQGSVLWGLATTERDGAFGAGSHECLTSQVKGILGKHNPCTFLLPASLPTEPHCSDTLSPSGKSYKLLLLCLVSVGLMKCACPPQVERSLSLPDCSNYPWCPAPLIAKDKCNVEPYSQRSPVPCAQDTRVLITSPFLFLVIWDGRKVLVQIDCSSAILPFFTRCKYPV